MVSYALFSLPPEFYYLVVHKCNIHDLVSTIHTHRSGKWDRSGGQNNKVGGQMVGVYLAFTAC